MKRFLAILAVMACLCLGACAPKTPQDLMADPSHHIVIKTNYPYLEAAKQFDVNYHNIIGGLDHVNAWYVERPDAKMVEYHQRFWRIEGMKYATYAQIREVDENHSEIDIYSYYYGVYFDIAVCAAIPLSTDKSIEVPWLCRPSTRQDGSPYQSQ